MENVKLTESFYLNVKDLTQNGNENLPKQTQLPTNFIFVIDVSGSMSNELDLIRKQMKNKLPSLLKEGDTVSIIWFSGRDTAGILKEDVEVKSLKNLQDLNDAIDRFLRPMGATAFHKPLVLTNDVLKRLSKNRPNSVSSLIFLTDGGNNDCPWKDVLKSLKELEYDLAASTFVEYGYYADSKAISEMASLIGGEKIEAERFDEYDIVFENKLKKTYSSNKKIIVDLPNNVMFDFAFSINENNEIILYSINNNQVLISEDVKRLLFFSDVSNTRTVISYDDPSNSDLTKLMYSSLYALTDRLQNDYVEDIFKSLGDKYLYNNFINAYGKQKLLTFKNLVKECISDNNKQFTQGRVKNLVVDENAYCVINMIDDLTKDESALFYPFHDDFNYKRIGAKKINKSNSEINESEKQLLATAKNIDELKEITESIVANKSSLIKFEYNDKNKGYSISNIVWSSDRANLSININYDGYINLPQNKFGINKIDTFQYRNYTLIKDGILNITKLPVSLSQHTFILFQNKGIINSNELYVPKQVYVLDFSSLPIVNKKMVKTISAKKLAEMEYELFKLKALEKVYKYYEEQHFPRESKGFVDLYGKEAESWLKELGITEFNGFAPSMTTEKSDDFYVAVQLLTKISNHSSLPKVIDVINKMNENKSIKDVDELMKIAIDDYNNQINSSLYKSLKDEKLKNEVLKTWLSTSKNEIKLKRRTLLQEIAQIKFSLILSKKWFEEFKSFDEKSITLSFDKKNVTFNFELKETNVNL